MYLRETFSLRVTDHAIDASSRIAEGKIETGLGGHQRKTSQILQRKLLKRLRTTVNHVVKGALEAARWVVWVEEYEHSEISFLECPLSR